ncbi:MAG TPA: right-handed parallel beta-helix repeat-containing protein [Verrucomicrobiales bacterium]|nr:right-handed parallel beta-helix repeat-containing protein [Verrucomicrobiales bacterium]
MIRLFTSLGGLLGVIGLFMLSESPAQAATFYVCDRAGDDTRSAAEAQRLDTPWKTIQRAAETMVSGDVCLIRAGTYRETVRPKTGQTFQNYAGEEVVITGCDVVPSGAWSRHDGNIHKVTVPGTVYDVFVDGAYMDKARWPNADADRMRKDEWVPTANSGRGDAGTVTFFEGLPADFVGGFYTGRNGPNSFNFNHGRIIAQSGNEISCTNLNFRWKDGSPGHVGTGTGNIIDHLNCLTTAKEWHWENNTLYLYPPDGGAPGGRLGEARVRIYGFDCSGRDAVVIRGLRFIGASLLMDGSNDCVVDDCSFSYVSPWGSHYYQLGATGGQNGINHYTVGGPIDGTAGLYFKGNNNTLKNSVVMYGWGSLVTWLGSNGTVINNHIESANWITRQHTANITVSGDNQKILNNTLRESTGKMIAFVLYDDSPVKGIRISGNDCRRYGYVMLDCGTSAMYTNGVGDLGGAEIFYNLIAENMTLNDRISCAIYLDDGSHNATIHHNVTHGGGHCRAALFTHRGNREIYVYNNTFWATTGGGWRSSVDAPHQRDQATMIFRNNHASGQAYTAGSTDSPITQDHNRSGVPASELVDPANYDFRIADDDSPSIDAGINIAGITDGFAGTAPDLGAYEKGGQDWRPGATVKPRR